MERYKAVQFGTVTWIVIDTNHGNRFVGKPSSKRIAERLAKQYNAENTEENK